VKTKYMLSALALMLAAGLPAMAQDDAKPAAAPAAAAKAEPALKAGMPAPEFKVEKFVKGEQFSSFEKGRVYVVEFWATWCGPCIMGMPHLSEVQREYKSKGVTVVGVNVWEDQAYTPETIDKVTKFVEGKGDTMDYTVVYDGGAKAMDTAWMQASGSRGIPTAFVVDQKGVVAWIGHPSQLDFVVHEVVAGKWDPEKGQERLDAAFKSFETAGEKYGEGVAAGDAAWTAAEKEYPMLAHMMASQKINAMLDAKLVKEACVLADRTIDEAKKAKNSGPIMEVLQMFSNPEHLSNPEARKLMVKAAEANFALGDVSTPGPHVILARAYFFAGETEKAKAASKKAEDLIPEAQREGYNKYMKQIEDQAAELNKVK